ncbi:hypothetical protein BCR32DRAFT_285064 [Anaeromyces robustus]|uniref:Uncharacterized protein n=1 Tax=Anaeromyces robustus TaxID=1754192 RepID=A0A1Y1WPV4_9FUNG|nr:hypothetical protein BCR32DRAFT_285064 [Anaeromyces robustus]|eukprot:ORX75579.1 hypothetical protein BCR32DRAFT_285064 [Anaeromyces robustus]
MIDNKEESSSKKINISDYFCDNSSRFLLAMSESDDKFNKIDCIFMGPSRSGSTKEFIESNYKMNIRKVVYISYDPKELVRDLRILKEFIML